MRERHLNEKTSHPRVIGNIDNLKASVSVGTNNPIEQQIPDRDLGQPRRCQKQDETWLSKSNTMSRISQCNAKSRNAPRLRSRAGGSEEAETLRIDQLAEAIQLRHSLWPIFSQSSTDC